MSALHFEGSDVFIDAMELDGELRQDLLDCGGSGSADEAVAYVMEHHEITGNKEHCKAYLRGCGAWEEEDLLDHHESLSRIVWLAGCSLGEGEPIYFNTYG